MENESNNATKQGNKMRKTKQRKKNFKNTNKMKGKIMTQ